ncbi:MAG: hypothetical protein D6820_05930, partial [Lentisphaerae bacterium]
MMKIRWMILLETMVVIGGLMPVLMQPANGEEAHPLSTGHLQPEILKEASTAGTEKLFDHNPQTAIKLPVKPGESSLEIAFRTPLNMVSGIQFGNLVYTGKNALKVMVSADTRGDGWYDTDWGEALIQPQTVEKLTVPMIGILAEIHGIKLSWTGKHDWQIGEMTFLKGNAEQETPLQPTPWSYRKQIERIKLPTGIQVSANFAVDPSRPLSLLVDGNPATSYRSKPGTAKKGRPNSIFLRFRTPIRDLRGIVLGPDNSTYHWKRMLIYADDTGQGRYSRKICEVTRREKGTVYFPEKIPQCYGLELRVVDQTYSGLRRAFMLHEVNGLLIEKPVQGGLCEVVVEDFEEFTTWRTWGINTGQPEGERMFGGYVYLCGIRAPQRAAEGQGVGVFHYLFRKTNKRPWRLWATRGDVVEASRGLIEWIGFKADSLGHKTKVWFELFDVKNRKLATKPLPLATQPGWRDYRIIIDPRHYPQLKKLQPPFRLKHVFLELDEPGDGEILVDRLVVGLAGQPA